MKQRQFNKYFNKEKKCIFYYKRPRYIDKINCKIEYISPYDDIVEIIFTYKKLKRSFKVKDFSINPTVIN